MVVQNKEKICKVERRRTEMYSVRTNRGEKE